MFQKEFIRDMSDCYLKVSPIKEDAFEERMIKYCAPSGVIGPERYTEDGNDSYLYKVTGMKPLMSAYGKKPLGTLAVYELLKKIYVILTESSSYLLSGDDMVLELDSMYMVLPEFDPKIIYYPGYGVDMMKQLETLGEKLMNCVDYSDENAVDLIYSAYMNIRDENPVEVLLKELEAKYEEKCLKSQAPVYSSVSKIPEHTAVSPDEEKEEKNTYFSWVQKRFKERKEEKTVKESAVESKPVLRKEFETDFVAEADKREAPPAVENMRHKDILYPSDEKTTLLFTKRTHYALLRSASGEEVMITKFPSYIGGMKQYCDIVIPDRSVSRLHAKIDKRHGKYYMADLNSTNGTSHMGVELQPGVEVVLSSGSDILFGESRYVFECE